MVVLERGVGGICTHRGVGRLENCRVTENPVNTDWNTYFESVFVPEPRIPPFPLMCGQKNLKISTFMGPKKFKFSGPTPSNAPRIDVAPLKTITYRAIKTTGTLIVIPAVAGFVGLVLEYIFLTGHFFSRFVPSSRAASPVS